MGSRGAPTSGAVKVLALRRAGGCGCGGRWPVGTRAGWDRQRRAVVCLDCLGEGLRFGVSGSGEAATVGVVATPEPSVADGDAAEEPPTPASPMEPSPTVVDVGSPGSSPQAEYERRAVAREGRVAARLAELSGPGVLFLHNRLPGQGHRDVDHVAVTAGGVYVIDAKRYKNAKVEVRRNGGLFSVSYTHLRAHETGRNLVCR